MSQDQRNMIIAVVLSLIVVIGWQIFVVGPQVEEAQRQAEVLAQQTAAEADIAVPVTENGEVATPNSNQTNVAQVFESREAALAATTDRVFIETESLSGSLNLVGARIDDLSLTKFNEEVDPESEIIHLLQPAGSPKGYYIEHGWITADGSSEGMPNEDTVWQVASGGTMTAGAPVTLTYDNGNGLVFNRTISVDQDYLFAIEDEVLNSAGGDVVLYPFSRIVRENLPTDLANFFILHEGPIGVMGESNLIEKSYDDLADEGTIENDANGGWLGFTDKYWATAIMPEDDHEIRARFVHTPSLTGSGAYRANFVERTAIVVPAGGTATNKAYAFAGAKVESVINTYELEYGFDAFELMIDWGWFHFITKPMFYLIRYLNSILGNFGLAILAVTLIAKAVFFPLANKSYASMAKMRLVQPQVKELQERYADDRPEQQKQMMELYKKEQINPLSGCWPMLIQIPVFFSLYKVLFVTIEMRHAPFFGWIQDLAVQDPTNVFNLFGLLPYDPTALPIIGAFLAIGIWPLIMGISMWVQMRLNPPPTDPTSAMIFGIMPIMFTFMLGTFPAGLVIYWAWNNILTIIQQYYIMRRHGAEVDLFGNILASFRRNKTPAE